MIAPLSIVLIAALCGSPPVAHVPASGSEAEKVLERIELPADIQRGRDELLALGPKSVPSWIDWLARTAVHEAGTELSSQDSCRSTAVICALGATARDVVAATLTRLGNSGSERERAAGLEVLVHLGGRDDFKLAIDLASIGDANEPPATLVSDAFERALVAILSRDPGADRTLADLVIRARPCTQATIITVLSRQGGDTALGLLAGLLGKISADTDALLLLEIGNRAAREPAPSDLLVLERVRGYLGHPDHRLGVLACTALEKLLDHEAIPDLIVLLGDSDQNLSARAHAALTSLTGLSLAREPEAWMAWLDDELAWWDERAADCRIALVSGSAVEAAAAVHEIAGHRLFQQRSAQILALALERPEADIVREAGRVLATLHVAPAASDDEEESQARPRPGFAQHPRTARDRTVRIPGRIRSRT